MHNSLLALSENMSFTDELATDVPAFLHQHQCPKTARHSADVAAQARRLAERFDVDPIHAEAAGWLHDISAVIPNAERIAAAQAWAVDILPEEATFPMIIHQKLSVVIAREIFNIHNEGVLSAIGCHTTLKQDASALDMVVFVADKIAWDQPGKPPYLDNLLSALDQSIEAAALVYLQYIWAMRDQLRVLHPWTRDAYQQLSKNNA